METESRSRTAPLLTAAAVLLGVAAFGSWAFLAGHRDAYLHLNGKSSVEGGELTLHLDGEEIYSRRLSAGGGGSLLGSLVEKEHETFGTHIKVESGVHEIVAAIADQGGRSRQQSTLVIDFKPGETRELSLVAGEGSGSPLSLTAD